MIKSTRSPITRLLRRLYRAGLESERARVPFNDVFDSFDKEDGADEGRRRFLRAAGAAVVLGAAGLPAPRLVRSMSVPRVGIVGGGAAGLACAHRLLHFGIPASVYEANSRLGGRIFTSRDFFDDGATVERGGEFISSEHRHTRHLAAELGLDLEIVNGGGFVGGGQEVYFINGQYYTAKQAQQDWFDGKVWKIFKSAIQDAPYAPTFDDFNAEHYRLDHLNLPDWLDEVGIGAESNLGLLLQTDAIVEYGPKAEEQTCLNLIYIVGYNGPSLQPLAGTDEKFHIVGGNDRLITELVDALPAGSVETSRVLEAISGDADGPYRCTFSGGLDVEFDVLVLALPFTTLREVQIDSRISTVFRPAKLDAINELTLGPNAKLHIQTNGRPWAMPLLTGGETVVGNGIAYSDPDSFICSWDATTTDTTTMAPVLVNYLGGDLGATLDQTVPFAAASTSDVNRFLSQIEPVFPGTSDAYRGKALSSFWAINPWSRGAYFSPRLGEYTRFFGAPGLQERNIHFCGEHTEFDAFGFIEGAVRTGRLAAKQIHIQS